MEIVKIILLSLVGVVIEAHKGKDEVGGVT